MKTRTLVIIISALMIYLLIGVLTGCRTKTVTEYVSVHDTLRISKTDTLYKTKTEISHDTLKIEVEKIVTLNENGDTMKLVIYKDRWRDRIVHQTDTIKEAKTDTLYISKSDEHEKETVKKQSWWSIWKWKIAAFSLLCALVFVLLRKYWSAIKNTFRTKIFK